MGYLKARMAVLNRKYDWKKKNAARKSVKIYVFRHGHTNFNQLHKFCGWRDSKLTDIGRRDARKVAVKMKNKKVDVAFHSSLSRSIDTLNLVDTGHTELKVKLCDDRLIERSYGKLEGKSHKWYVDKYGEAALHNVRRGYSVHPPGGESVKDVEKRVKSFVVDLLMLCKDYKINVVLSVHGNSMRPIRRYFEKLSVKEMMYLENPWDEVFVYTVKL